MGGDVGDAQGTGGVPPPGGEIDHGDDVEPWSRQRLGVPLSSGGIGRRGDPPNWGVHKETAGNHSGKGVTIPHILDIHGGGEDTGDESNGAMVGPERGK